MSTELLEDALTTSVEIHTPRKNVKKRVMKSNISASDAAERAPPLELQIDREVLVVNGDRSNLSWKRYKLLQINERTGMCVVEGISDSRQRNFPRSVVKPKVHSRTQRNNMNKHRIFAIHNNNNTGLD